MSSDILTASIMNVRQLIYIYIYIYGLGGGGDDGLGGGGDDGLGSFLYEHFTLVTRVWGGLDASRVWGGLGNASRVWAEPPRRSSTLDPRPLDDPRPSTPRRSSNLDPRPLGDP